MGIALFSKLAGVANLAPTACDGDRFIGRELNISYA
jgi:hypothetical protein